ncbi:hypothetical protein RUM44_002453 [Polyplax serrata]|uniref:Uncharacterized protein n=1 Tax=Polyplax serrata TaxID=468196 RepID=A0ABR1AEU8_POLSC
MGEKNSRKEKLGKRQKDEEVEDGSKMSPARSFRSDEKLKPSPPPVRSFSRLHTKHLENPSRTHSIQEWMKKVCVVYSHGRRDNRFLTSLFPHNSIRSDLPRAERQKKLEVSSRNGLSPPVRPSPT